MCGIFGFIGTAPDLARLRRIAAETETRGRHAFGLAWRTPAGVKTFKRPGAATDNLADIDRCHGADAIIGHCRWATHGSPDDNRNNHPHPAGRGWLVHNGVVLNHANLARRYRLAPQTACDSEIIALLVARFAGSLASRGARTAATLEGTQAFLGLWANPTRLLVVRRGNPLFVGSAAEGLYFGSCPENLPGSPSEVKDDTAVLLTGAGADLDVDACPIAA